MCLKLFFGEGHLSLELIFLVQLFKEVVLSDFFLHWNIYSNPSIYKIYLEILYGDKSFRGNSE